MTKSVSPPETAPENYWAGRTSQDRTLFSRFENKYVVPPSVVPAMRRYLGTFVRPDDYAIRYPDFTYSICSLYLDSNDLMLYNMTVQGIKNRYKLRIRSYSDDPLVPVFCEIKRRMNGVIIKRRGRIDREGVAALVAGRLPEGDSLYPGSRPALEEFRSLAFSTHAKPVTRVKYRREAYISAAGDPVRVTFDTQVKGAWTPDCSVDFEGGRWVPVHVGEVILEIKFTERYPSWLSDFVRTFEIRQRSVAKYVACVQATQRDMERRPWLPRPAAHTVERG